MRTCCFHHHNIVPYFVVNLDGPGSRIVVIVVMTLFRCSSYYLSIFIHRYKKVQGNFSNRFVLYVSKGDFIGGILSRGFFSGGTCLGGFCRGAYVGEPEFAIIKKTVQFQSNIRTAIYHVLVIILWHHKIQLSSHTHNMTDECIRRIEEIAFSTIETSGEMRRMEVTVI